MIEIPVMNSLGKVITVVTKDSGTELKYFLSDIIFSQCDYYSFSPLDGQWLGRKERSTNSAPRCCKVSNVHNAQLQSDD